MYVIQNLKKLTFLVTERYLILDINFFVNSILLLYFLIMFRLLYLILKCRSRFKDRNIISH